MKTDPKQALNELYINSIATMLVHSDKTEIQHALNYLRTRSNDFSLSPAVRAIYKQLMPTFKKQLRAF